MEPAIYREKDVLAMIGVSKATLWRWRKDGRFPNPCQLGPNTVGWRRESFSAMPLTVHELKLPLAACPLATGEARAA